MNLVFHELIAENDTLNWTSVESKKIEMLLGSKFFLKHCLLTFDDGNKSDIDVALPLLKKYDAKGIFFIVTEFIGIDGYCTKSDIKNLQINGMTIGSHTKSHKNLTQCTLSQLRKELEDSKKHLEDILQTEVEHFSIPFGEYNEQVIIEAKRVYGHVYTSCPLHLSKKLNGRLSFHGRTEFKVENWRQYHFVLAKSLIKYHTITFMKRCIGYENYKKLKATFYG